jgi:primosomal protein N' (replication factor Y)
VSRIQSLYIRAIMLKIETEASMVKVKQILRDLFIEVQASPAARGFTIYYDVDPA